MQTTNVLLVEDRDETRELLCDMLGLLGYSPVAVASAEEALEKLEQRFFPVLLTDVVLPGMSGIALAERVHASSPATRIILTTGQGFLLSDGLPFAFTLIPKPFHMRHLQDALGDASPRVSWHSHAASAATSESSGY